MNYLLDTHTFLWAIFDPKKISKKIQDIILDKNNNVYVSLVTFWEISIKYSIGKLSLKNVLPDELPTYAEKSGFEILDIDHDLLSTFYRLPKKEHKDPFDRLIIWQCINNKFTLLSKDSSLKEYKDLGLKAMW